MSRQPVVLFVCTHNAGRSLAARLLLDHYARGRIDVRSAGSDPADDLNPAVAAVLRERGLDPTGEHPKLLTTEDGLAADVIVTMGCGDACPVHPATRYLDWDLPDPAGRGVDAVRPIVDDIDRRVRALLAELTTPAPARSEAVTGPTTPDGCTLDGAQAGARVEEWRRALRRSVVAVERPDPRRLRMGLVDDPAAVADLVRLARAEKACCPFFDFRLDIGAGGATLVVEVPSGSEPVLDDFAGPGPTA